MTLADQAIFDEDYRRHIPFSSLMVDPQDQKTIDPMFSAPVRLPTYIPPESRVLMSTIDVVDIPKGHIGIIGLRSTWARLGFMSPMTIADAGFKGTLTMELYNTSPQRILVRPGDKVWTMHLVPCVGEDIYEGRYQGQLELTRPKALPKTEEMVTREVRDPRRRREREDEIRMEIEQEARQLKKDNDDSR